MYCTGILVAYILSLACSSADNDFSLLPPNHALDYQSPGGPPRKRGIRPKVNGERRRRDRDTDTNMLIGQIEKDRDREVYQEGLTGGNARSRTGNLRGSDDFGGEDASDYTQLPDHLGGLNRPAHHSPRFEEQLLRLNEMKAPVGHEALNPHRVNRPNTRRGGRKKVSDGALNGELGPMQGQRS